MNEPKDFDEWMASSKKQREALLEYAKSPMPSDRSGRDEDIEKSIRGAEAAGEHLANCQFFLTQKTAQAILTAKDLTPEIKGWAREALIKDSVKEVQRLYDYLEVLTKTLNSRVRAGCNARRSIL